MKPWVCEQVQDINKLVVYGFYIDLVAVFIFLFNVAGCLVVISLYLTLISCLSAYNMLMMTTCGTWGMNAQNFLFPQHNRWYQSHKKYKTIQLILKVFLCP